MFNLFDLMRAAQGGAAMENMARQFGLSVDQTRRATEALMPAFALGFRRNAADPMGFANLLGMMGSGQYASFFDQPGLAFTPRAWSEGNQVLGQLFGPEVSRQVAEQTAAWAGVGPEIMKQMMPTVATMLMGGLFRSAANEGLADMFEQFAKALRGETDVTRSGSGRNAGGAGAITNPFSAWADMVDTMWGTHPPVKPSEPERSPPDETPNPFGAWAAMMSGMLGSDQPARPTQSEPQPEPAPESEPAPEPESPPLQTPFEFFGHMFETGREAQQQHLATLQNIFDTYWGTARERR
jgi:hypothetical protein